MGGPAVYIHIYTQPLPVKSVPRCPHIQHEGTSVRGTFIHFYSLLMLQYVTVPITYQHGCTVDTIGFLQHTDGYFNNRLVQL